MALALLVFGATAPAQLATQINGDGTLTVVRGGCTSGPVIIPDSIAGRKVTIIGNGAFVGCPNLTSVTIPDSVTSIGANAFQECFTLTNVTIPASVTNIGPYAFIWCTNLTSVMIPDSVSSIGYRAFEGCAGLTGITVDPLNAAFTSVDGVLFDRSGAELVIYPGGKTGAYTIPNTVTSIGDEAFIRCSNLTGVTIPDSVTSIGESAFEGCASLANIDIPGSVTSFRAYAFSRCTSLTSVTIEKGVNSVGELAFSWCTNLTSVAISDSVTRIGFRAFRGCTGLVNCTIPGSVTNVGAEAFSVCTNVKRIDIPDSVTRIEYGTFSGCTGLANVTIPESVTTIGAGAFEGCTNLTTVTVPDSVAEIDDGVFTGCTSLTSIAIPRGVIRIGDDAFAGCTGLRNVIIPDSVTAIGSRVFAGCTGLLSISMPESVIALGEETFSGCVNLQSITIPKWITRFHSYVFSGCDKLTAAYFQADRPEFYQPASQSFFFGNATTVFYLPGTIGWSTTFSDRPTALWVLESPTILDFGDRFGPTTNGFSFVISWATNLPVVVEASTDIAGQGWTPISTNTLADGWVQFIDPDWKSQAARFYRVRGAPGVQVLAGPVTNPGNGHRYVLLSEGTWTASEAKAVQLGGHLATINDEAENQWVFDTFARYGGMERGLWIGLTDQAQEGVFEWADGTPISFARWADGEPNDHGGGEDWVHIFYPQDTAGRAPSWNDFPDVWIFDATGSGQGWIPFNGVVELP